MKTDRELLEAAAKAAGIFLTPEQFAKECPSPWDPDMDPYYDEETNAMHGWRTWYSSSGERGGWEAFRWAPMADDGDALRLAVGLGMDIKRWNSLAIASKAWNKHAEENISTQCPYAATRRAIVRAAAAMAQED